MKLGVKKFQYVPVSRITDYSFFPAGGKINIDDYISGVPEDLPFIQELTEYNEDWRDDSKGRYSIFSFSSKIRKGKEENRQIFQKLLRTDNIYIITFIDGKKAIIGSKEFVPSFTFSDSSSGFSKTDLSFKVELKSLHGVLWGA